MKLVQKIGLGLGTLALGVGAAVGVTNAAEPTTASPSTPAITSTQDAGTNAGTDAQAGGMQRGQRGQSAQTGTSGTTSGTDASGTQQGMPADMGQGGEMGGRGGHGGPGRMAAQLATALNLDEATVEQAMQDAMSQMTPPDQGGDPSQMDTQLAAALASSLGVDQATIEQALADLHAQGPGGDGGQMGAPDDQAASTQAQPGSTAGSASDGTNG